MISIEQLYDLFEQHPVITTDSRDCPAGSIFFALKGETFNGNQYAKQALDKGCAYAVVDEIAKEDEDDKRMFLVDNVLLTLQQLAQFHRRRLGTTVIGITGTNGKTTTKELIAAVLKRKYNILYTQGNFNNSIGVPKTVLQLRPEHELAVIEMGASHPGDINELVNIAEPDYGIITNVGRAHLLGFGSFEGVVRTKGELYDFIRQHGGTVFINAADTNLMGIADGLRLIKYADDGNFISSDPFLRFKWNGHEVQTQLIGAYNINNALAAAMIGHNFGVPDDDICQALSEYTPSNNRSQFVQTATNRLIVDAYNANPTSMMASLRNFSDMKATNKLAILGDMRELGEVSQDEHCNIIRFLASQGIEAWLVGDEFAKAADSLSTSDIAGYASSVRCFADAEAIKHYIADNQPADRTILVKGSNGTRLFTLPEIL